jgi:hypothetical protein
VPLAPAREDYPKELSTRDHGQEDQNRRDVSTPCPPSTVAPWRLPLRQYLGGDVPEGLRNASSRPLRWHEGLRRPCLLGFCLEIHLFSKRARPNRPSAPYLVRVAFMPRDFATVRACLQSCGLALRTSCCYSRAWKVGLRWLVNGRAVCRVPPRPPYRPRVVESVRKRKPLSALAPEGGARGAPHGERTAEDHPLTAFLAEQHYVPRKTFHTTPFFATGG